MVNGVNISIIGAGSAQFSAGIVRDICVNSGLHGSHVTLMDVDGKRLDKITQMAERLSKELEAKLTFTKTADRLEAIRGADFIINTAQVGGHPWSEAQREVAEKHGYYRGASLHALGQMAFFLDLAQDIERISPNAYLIESANPVFEGCTLMTRETKVKVIGLCHGHYGYREIADVLGLDRKEVTAVTAGFNHWIWLMDFRYKGKDAYPLIDEWIENRAEEYWANLKPRFSENQMSRAAVDQYKLFGRFPIGDTPRMVDYPKVTGWWYNENLESKKKWFGALGGFDSEIGWKLYLEELSENLEKIEALVSDPEKKVSDFFKPVQSDEQIVPIIDSLVNDKERVYQVNIPNKGRIIKGFPEDLVVECHAVINGSGVSGVQSPEFPRKLYIGAMIPRWYEAETMIEIVRSGDRDILKQWFLMDHRTKSISQAEETIEEWLTDPRNECMKKRMPKS